MSVQVLNAGKHCACTIPMGMSMKELEDVIKARKASGKHYMFMETSVYTREYLYVKELYESGAMGKLADRHRTYSLTIRMYARREHETFQMSPYISRDQEAELLSLLPNTRGVRWHPDFVDLIPADGGKDRGIQRFLDHYGWSKEQTISFGDGGNDVDMLRFTGIGVAMGNATVARPLTNCWSSPMR